jgi:hypothetical protein
VGILPSRKFRPAPTKFARCAAGTALDLFSAAKGGGTDALKGDFKALGKDAKQYVGDVGTDQRIRAILDRFDRAIWVVVDPGVSFRSAFVKLFRSLSGSPGADTGIANVLFWF